MDPRSLPAVVLDTNVALDWLLFDNPMVKPLVAAIEAGKLHWLATPPMRQELAHMLGHRSLSRWPGDRERALTVFDAHAQIRSLAAVSAPRCTDPDDQMFIDLAIAECAWLVTHDRALLKLRRRAMLLGAQVSTPAAWCAHHAALPPMV